MSLPLKKQPRFSLRWTLPLLIITPLVAAVALIAFLSYRSNYKTVMDFITKLNSKATQEIEHEIEAQLEYPNAINNLHLGMFSSEELNMNNLMELEPYLIKLANQSNLKMDILFGNEKGEGIGIERQENGEFLLWVRNRETGNYKKYYEIKNRETRGEFEKEVEYDPRKRSWYITAKEAEKATWSPIYPFASATPVLGMTYVIPVYNNAGTFQGVTAVDLTLVEISKFLQSLNISQNGQAFIVESSGEIIASSETDSLFSETQGGEKRVEAVNSSNLVIQAIAIDLLNKFNSYQAIDDQEEGKLTIGNDNYHYGVIPVNPELGLDWWVVVTIPERDFKEVIYNSVYSTVTVGLIVAGIAAIIGILVTRWINRPILVISKAATALESGNIEMTALSRVSKRQDELGELAQVFEQMALEVQGREQGLKQQLQQLRSESDQAKKVQLVSQIAQKNHLENLLRKSKRLRNKTEEYEKINIFEVLKTIPYFQNFSDAEIRNLANRGDKKIVREGQYLFREGDAGDAFFILLEGSVGIYVDKLNKHIRDLGKGSFFGEMSLLLKMPRTASVKTNTDTLLFVLTSENLQEILASNTNLMEAVIEKMGEYQAELASRKDLLKEAGLIDDEESFVKSPLNWVRHRMISIFGSSSRA
ncbi:MAG: cyclic nucleotide-binding domain-containing protein [Chroococcales cyanobacterium]